MFPILSMKNPNRTETLHLYNS